MLVRSALRHPAGDRKRDIARGTVANPDVPCLSVEDVNLVPWIVRRDHLIATDRLARLLRLVTAR
jgi:hypothetical protein